MLYSIKLQIRLPEAGETIGFARLSEVAFYEVAFHVGLRLPSIPQLG